MKIGIKGEYAYIVAQEQLASAIGSGLVDVFATPMMIAGMEKAAADSVQPFVGEGKTTVGMRIDATHEAATPLGMGVRFTSELIGISPNGKALTFCVVAYDDCGLIGKGTHERVIVSTDRFEARAQSKFV